MDNIFISRSIRYVKIFWYKYIGERKAIFEDCESEKTENKDRIKKLKDEVRDLQAEVQASNKSSEGILRHVQVWYCLFPPFLYFSAVVSINKQKLISFVFNIFHLLKERKYLDTNVLKKKSGDHAVECLDFKVQDLRKKLNKLRYQARTKQQRIESLMKEYEKVVMINADIEKAE